MPEASTREQLRAAMPVAERYAYFDHAAVAPLSGPAQAAMHEWANALAEQGDVDWPRWPKRLEQLRRRAAEMVRAQPDEIALVPNTTAGVNLVAEGFPWQPGDNVIVFQGEFPTNLLPWHQQVAKNVEVRELPTVGGRVDLDAVSQACDARTRVIAVSWVGFATGFRTDLAALAEIAHRHGGYLFVDAIQALGVQPLDVEQTPIDFFAADGHKWLLGPEGAGIFYLRGECLDLLRPLETGWNSLASGEFSGDDLQLKHTAARYEGGSHNIAGFVGLAASVDLLADLGVPQIATAIYGISNHACERLRSIGAEIVSDRSPKHASGIVAFNMPGVAPLAARKKCLDAGVVLSVRAGRLRIAPHAYTNEADVDRLIDVLKSL